MTTTTTTGVGRVARIIGPVVDVEFPVDAMPEIFNALTIDYDFLGETRVLTLEVAQHIGDNMIREIAMKPTDGPISVPVGDITKGHVFDVTGNVLNLKEGETFEVKERWGIHRKAPSFDQLD